MTEDMEVTLARLEALATPVGEPKPLFGYEVVATLLKHIRELQKRIGGLEAGHNQHSLAMHDKLMRALEQKECAQIALTAERQRREDCEDALRPFKYSGLYPNRYEEAVNTYFSRYPFESDK